MLGLRFQQLKGSTSKRLTNNKLLWSVLPYKYRYTATNTRSLSTSTSLNSNNVDQSILLNFPSVKAGDSVLNSHGLRFPHVQNYITLNLSSVVPFRQSEITVTMMSAVTTSTGSNLIREEMIREGNVKYYSPMELDSVLRKRRKKMKKHKLRKRRRRERAEKRKLSQGR